MHLMTEEVAMAATVVMENLGRWRLRPPFRSHPPRHPQPSSGQQPSFSTRPKAWWAGENPFGRTPKGQPSPARPRRPRWWRWRWSENKGFISHLNKIISDLKRSDCKKTHSVVGYIEWDVRWSYFSLQMVNDELVTYAIPQIEIKLKTFLVEYRLLNPEYPA